MGIRTTGAPAATPRETVTWVDRSVDAAFAGGEPELVIVIGLGDGRVLDAIGRRSGRTRVLAIQPVPARGPEPGQRRDWSRWLHEGRLTVLAGPDYPGASNAFRLVAPGVLPTVITDPQLARAFKTEAAAARTLAARIIVGARANEEARRRFAGPYLLNTLENIPEICAEGDVSALTGLLPGRPGIVIAAGPSLDRALDDLRRLQDRAVLISVDTALRPLLCAGIRPHVVVAVDPQEANARHLAGIPDADGVFFVAEGSLDKTAFPPFVGRTFFFSVSPHHPWNWLAGLGVHRGSLKAWGSVLTTAFDLTCLLGCDPVVFVGADLAFSDGRSYCRNTIYDKPGTAAVSGAPETADLAERPGAPALPEADVRGRRVQSAARFVQFRDWIVSRATEVSPRRIVNATGEGILHGSRIEQGTLETFVQWPQLDGGADVRMVLAEAWQRSRSGAPMTGLVERALDVSNRAAVPIEEWRAFTGDSASVHMIAEALDRASAVIGGGDSDAGAGPALEARVHAVLQAAAVSGRPTPDLAEGFRLRGKLGAAEAVALAMYARPDCTVQDALSRIADDEERSGRKAHALHLRLEEYHRGRQSTGRTVALLKDLLDGGRTDEASAMAAAIVPTPSMTDADLYGYAVALARLGRIAEGERWMRQAYGRSPGLKNGLSLVGWEYRKTGNAARALECLRDDCSMHRQTPGWTVNYVIQLLDMNHRDLAAAALAALPANRVSSMPALCHYAICLARLDQTAEAEAVMERVYAMDPSAVDGFARIGWTRVSTEDWRGALRLLEIDQERGRLSPAWRVNLGQVLGQTGDFDRARAEVERAYRDDARVGDGFAKLGWIEAAAGHWRAALDLMVVDRARGRLSPASRLNLAVVLARTGDLPGAQAEVEAAYHADSRASSGFARLGWVRAMARDWPGALLLMERDLNAGRLSAAWKPNVAVVLAKQARMSEAEALVGQAYRENGALADGFARLGWVKAEAADWDGACELLERDDRAGTLTPLWRVNHVLAEAVAAAGSWSVLSAEPAEPAVVESLAAMRDGAWKLPAWFESDATAAFARHVAEVAPGAGAPRASGRGPLALAWTVGRFVENWNGLLLRRVGDERQQVYTIGRARLRELLIDRDWPEAVSAVAEGRLAATPRRDGQPLSDYDLDVYFGDLVRLVAGVPGDVAEFGVFKGFSLSAIARHAPNRQVWGFDSWQGLPAFTHQDEADRPSFRGQGSLAASKADVAATFANAGLGFSNVHLVDGWFKDTIFRLEDRPLALVNLDADLYESCRLVLEAVWPLLSPGGIISLDEYNEPYFPGARIAVDEFLAREDVRGRYRLEKHRSVSRYYVTKA